MERSGLAKADAENVDSRSPDRSVVSPDDQCSPPGGFQARRVQLRTNASAARTVREILAILHKWGIHTLGQFAALNREDLAARLGSEAVRLWERANGKTTRLLKLVQPS